jgi:hypothetical protein
LIERVKSAVLFFLVLLSILLTYQLWYGRKPVERVITNGYEPAYFEEPKPLSQLVIPKCLVVYQENLCYRIRPGNSNYKHFWEELSRMLQEIDEPANYEYGEKLPADAELCLNLIFDPALPVGPESVWLKNAPSGGLTGMQIWRQADRCWGILQEGEETGRPLLLPAQWGAHLAALCEQFSPSEKSLCEQIQAGELQLPRNGTVTVSAPIYVSAGKPVMADLLLKAEALDGELLLNTFFINRSLVREIKEKDGGLIYTDGEQGLRLHHGLDYSCPRIEQKPVPLSYPAALLTGGKLLCYYGGWPENLRLESLVQEAGARGRQAEIYQAQWRSYLKGYLLLGDAEVAMTYHHGGLVDYRRKLYELHYQKGDDTVVQDYREALAAAVELLAAKGVEQYILEEMDLAYYLTGGPLQPRAIPVWAIRISGRELILEASELIPPEGWEK